MDCAGVCEGILALDECGICGGPGFDECGGCDWLNTCIGGFVLEVVPKPMLHGKLEANVSFLRARSASKGIRKKKRIFENPKSFSYNFPLSNSSK